MNILKNFFFNILISLIIYTTCIYNANVPYREDDIRIPQLFDDPQHLVSSVNYLMQSGNVIYSPSHKKNLELIQQIFISLLTEKDTKLAFDIGLDWDSFLSPEYYAYIDRITISLLKFVYDNTYIIYSMIQKRKIQFGLPLGGIIGGSHLLAIFEETMLFNVKLYSFLLQILRKFRILQQRINFIFRMDIVESKSPVILFLKINRESGSFSIFITNKTLRSENVERSKNIEFTSETRKSEEKEKKKEKNKEKKTQLMSSIEKYVKHSLQKFKKVHEVAPPKTYDYLNMCSKYGYKNPTYNWIDFFSKYEEALCRVEVIGDGDCLFSSLAYLLNIHNINKGNLNLNPDIVESRFTIWYLNNLKPQHQKIFNSSDIRYLTSFSYIRYFPGFNNHQEPSVDYILEKLKIYANLEVSNLFANISEFEISRSLYYKLVQKSNILQTSKIKHTMRKILKPPFQQQDTSSSTSSSTEDNTYDLSQSSSSDDDDFEDPLGIIPEEKVLVVPKRKFIKTDTEKTCDEDTTQSKSPSSSQKIQIDQSKEKSEASSKPLITRKRKIQRESLSPHYKIEPAETSSASTSTIESMEHKYESITIEIDEKNCRKLELIFFIIVSLSENDITLEKLMSMELSNIEKLVGPRGTIKILPRKSDLKWAINGNIIPYYQISQMKELLSDPFHTKQHESSEKYLIILKSTFNLNIIRSVDGIITKTCLLESTGDQFSHSSIKHNDIYITSDKKAFENSSGVEKSISFYYERTRPGNNHWGDETDCFGFSRMLNTGLVFFLNGQTKFFFKNESLVYPIYYYLYYHSDIHFEPAVHLKIHLESVVRNFSYLKEEIPQSFQDITELMHDQ